MIHSAEGYIFGSNFPHILTIRPWGEPAVVYMHLCGPWVPAHAGITMHAKL